MASSRPAALLPFALTAFAVLGAIHYYLWLRLVRDPALPAPWRGVATALLVLLAASMPAVLVLSRSLPLRTVRLLAWPAYTWMGLMLLLLVALVGADVVRAALRVVELASRHGLGTAHASALPGVPEALFDPERRLALLRGLGAVAAGVGVALGARAVHEARSEVAVKEVEVRLARLPLEADGVRIVQLSDVHIGPTLDGAWLTGIVERVNALAPDLVVITGDLVDGSVAELRDQVAPLAALRARHGVYFVTGNHEYYSGAAAWVAELARLGLRVLRNERVAIALGTGFDLAGVDDYNSRGLAPGHGQDLPRALAGRDPARAVVLLAHQPRSVFEAAALGVDLQLSGHTHGGQIWPWNFLVRLQQPYVAGLVRHGPTWLYISRGTGYWGPPMRLGAPPEITHLTLRSGAA